MSICLSNEGTIFKLSHIVAFSTYCFSSHVSLYWLRSSLSLLARVLYLSLPPPPSGPGPAPGLPNPESGLLVTDISACRVLMSSDNFLTFLSYDSVNDTSWLRVICSYSPVAPRKKRKRFVLTKHNSIEQHAKKVHTENRPQEYA